MGSAVPSEYIGQLTTDLAESLPTRRRLRSADQLIQCQMSHVCSVNPKITLDIFTAIFKNPRLTRAAKAASLEWLAIYYANVLGDLPAARRVMSEAASLCPEDWLYRLRLVELAIIDHDRESAAKLAMTLPHSLGFWARHSNPAVNARLSEVGQQLALSR